ncbi:MAG TPA: hypothetical protein VFN35_02510, partial [Ktedonobacteraceae bacterium]|nr:hypothetical protein [Ktedonobacteraceae bacterium]
KDKLQKGAVLVQWHFWEDVFVGFELGMKMENDEMLRHSNMGISWSDNMDVINLYYERSISSRWSVGYNKQEL